MTKDSIFLASQKRAEFRCYKGIYDPFTPAGTTFYVAVWRPGKHMTVTIAYKKCASEIERVISEYRAEGCICINKIGYEYEHLFKI